MLKRLILLSLLAVGSGAHAQQASSSAAPTKCDIGPVKRTFGGTKWLVYSCNDQISLVIVSAPGNPAMPFYFFLTPEGASYRLMGEGNGSKTASKAALDDLSKLTRAEIAALFAATKAVQRRL